MCSKYNFLKCCRRSWNVNSHLLLSCGTAIHFHLTICIANKQSGLLSPAGYCCRFQCLEVELLAINKNSRGIAASAPFIHWIYLGLPPSCYNPFSVFVSLATIREVLREGEGIKCCRKYSGFSTPTDRIGLGLIMVWSFFGIYGQQLNEA